MTPYEIIRLAGGSLRGGESVRGVCPFCHGGRTKEESFLITRKGGDLAYTCFRATCTGRSSGVLSISGNPTVIGPVRKKDPQHVLRCETFPLSQETAGMLRDKFQFTVPMLEYYGLSQTRDGDIIIPIYNSRGLIQGHERKMKDRTRGKAIRYNGSGADGMGWYNLQPKYKVPDEYLPPKLRDRPYVHDCLFLVEDLYSAMKVNAFVHSAALLGTTMSPERAGALAIMKYRHIYLALDADATHRAAGLSRRYRSLLPELRVITLHKDIKDMPYYQVAGLLSDDH